MPIPAMIPGAPPATETTMPSTTPRNFVRATPAAQPEDALEHFTARLELETDCWDVHASMKLDDPGFVLVDVWAPEYFDAGHIPGAINIPHPQLTEERLAEFPSDLRFVVYCAGPHCNGASKGAVRLATLGRPVKEMIGGAIGWLDEGYELVATPSTPNGARV